jgi:dTDP-L-rhamnose 4-epimerase
MAERVLVTGGAGFIGRHLVQRLLTRGYEVRVLDALVEQVHGPGAQADLPDEVEFIRADVTDFDAVSRAIRDVDRIVHLAAEVGVGQSMYEIRRYVGANAGGTASLLEALILNRGRVSKVVVASSMSVYGEGAYECDSCKATRAAGTRDREALQARAWDHVCPVCGGSLRPVPTSEDKRLDPGSVYAISKLDQEWYVLGVTRAYGIPSVALRYFNVFGPGQALNNPYTGLCANVIARLMNDRPPLIFEDGRQMRDFVHVDDIVTANVLALESDKVNREAINVGSGRATTVLDIAQLICGAMDKPPTCELANEFREGDIRHCFADISRARAVLGFEPSIEMQAGIEGLVSWVRTQPGIEDHVSALAEALRARGIVK